jgi:hypothetical protein
MAAITEKRRVACSGTPRVLKKCIDSIAATGATAFVVLIGAPYSSLSLLNIAVIAVFTKASH